MKEFSIKFFLSHIKHSISSSRPAYLHSLVNLNHSRSTLVTLNCPSNPSHLQITNRSFYQTTPALWNRLPSQLRQLAPLSSTSPLAISPTLFHKKTKNSSFSFFFSTLVCTWPRLHLDGYPPGIDLGLFHHCHFLFILTLYSVWK